MLSSWVQAFCLRTGTECFCCWAAEAPKLADFGQFLLLLAPLFTNWPLVSVLLEREPSKDGCSSNDSGTDSEILLLWQHVLLLCQQKHPVPLHRCFTCTWELSGFTSNLNNQCFYKQMKGTFLSWKWMPSLFHQVPELPTQPCCQVGWLTKDSFNQLAFLFFAQANRHLIATIETIKNMAI